MQPNSLPQQQTEFFLLKQKSCLPRPAAGQMYSQLLHRNAQYCKHKEKRQRTDDLLSSMMVNGSWCEISYKSVTNVHC